jgi:hypothetical protein
MGALAVPLALAGTVFSAGSSILGASGKASQLEAQADALERSAQAGRIKAAQTDTSMAGQLQSTLGNIMAVRAASDAAGPTTDAIINRTMAVGNQNRQNKVMSIDAQANADEAAANAADQQIPGVMMGGILGAGGSLMTGLGGSTRFWS